jgi:hypothetical protein
LVAFALYAHEIHASGGDRIFQRKFAH